MRRSGLWWKAASCGLALGGCTLVAPLEELNRERPGEADSGTLPDDDPSSPDGPCVNGDRRCVGRAPQVCIATEWKASRECQFACKAGDCVGECEPGTRQCNGNAAELCDESYTWVTEPCKGTCEAGRCVASCSTGTLQCAADQVLQRCVDGKFAELEQCAGVCVDKRCQGVCREGAERCAPEGQSTEICDASGRWQSLADCSGETPFCAESSCQVCSPGTRRCAEDLPQVCTQSGAWETRDPCTAGLVCVEGECLACEPSHKRCTGNTVEVCALDGSAWVEQEKCAGETPACIPDAGSCGACASNESSCDDDTPQTCDGNGSWVQSAPCSAETPQCIGKGECAACDASETPTRCLDDLTMQICSETGTWVTTLCLDPTPACNSETGRCGCVEGERRCDPLGVPEACILGSWVSESACLDPLAECHPLSGLCVACKPGAEECQANSAYACDASGAWQPLGGCAGSDVNCGGCDLGDSCAQDDQCVSQNCVAGRCQVAEVCNNGEDDDLDGAADCADTGCGQSACFPIPPGWSGPVALATTDLVQFPGVCPSSFPTEALSLFGDLSAEPVQCSACTCSDTLGCSSGQLVTYASCQAPTPTSATTFASNSCQAFSAAPPQGIKLRGGQISGACALSGGGNVTATSAPQWNTEMRACAAPALAVGCSATERCLPASPPGEFEGRYCVYSPGDVSCPGGYPNKRIFFTDYEDNRTCSECHCAATGDCISAAWQLHSSPPTTCDSAGPEVRSACLSGQPDCPCEEAPAGTSSISYSPTLACAASGGQPIGAASGRADSAVSVCCQD